MAISEADHGHFMKTVERARTKAVIDNHEHESFARKSSLSRIDYQIIDSATMAIVRGLMKSKVVDWGFTDAEFETLFQQSFVAGMKRDEILLNQHVPENRRLSDRLVAALFEHWPCCTSPPPAEHITWRARR